jgi:hypothetical protein
MEKRPTKEQLATFKKNANDMSLSAEVRAKFKAIVDKFENIGEEVVDVVEGKKERKPRTPKATTTRKPRATKQTGDDVEKAKAEIKKRTGKTEEECEKIVEEYRSLRSKSQERKKKEAEASKSNVARINKLKGDNKVIEGTNEKTADAVIQSTTKDVAEKIEKQIEVVEKKAETEAKKEVEKEMPKVSATEKKKEVEKKVEEKVKAKTKTIVKRVVIDTSALLTSIAESLGKFDKDSQKEFLIKLRSDIDKLLAKYSGGGMTMGATQGYNITQSNLSSSSVNPTMFNEGGGVKGRQKDDFNKLVGSIDNEFYFVDYIFNYNDGFKGATGTIVMPVSKEYYDLATSEEGILDRYMTAMGEDEWLEALGLDRDDFEDEDEMIKAIEDGIYNLYRVGELNPFEEVNYKLEEQMRKLPEFSDSDEYPIFETSGGGRIFGKDTKFDKIYDQELYNKIRKIEEFKRGGGVYNRSWHFDRARHNKSENYEVPLNKRKAHGGTIEERMRMRRGM